MKRIVASLAVMVAVVMFSTSAHALVTFSDSTFNNADWVTFTETLVNGGTSVGSQQVAGGNPGSYRRVLDTINAGANSAVWGFHYRTAALYDPTASGAVDAIDLMMDTIMIQGFGQGQATGIALRQNGKNYYVGGLFANQNTWTSQSQIDLKANDFSTLSNPNDHPDFSATGAQMQFGYRAANSTTGAGYTILSGYDNWKVEIFEPSSPVIPEPATLALFGTGLLGLIRRKRS